MALPHQNVLIGLASYLHDPQICTHKSQMEPTMHWAAICSQFYIVSEDITIEQLPAVLN